MIMSVSAGVIRTDLLRAWRLCRLYYIKQFVFQVQALFFKLFGELVGRSFYALFYASYLMIYIMVFVEQSGEVGVAGFQFVNTFLMFGQFMN